MSLGAGSRVGPYEILAPLGAGGMGEVYRARDTRLDRVVAIKVLAAHVIDDPAFRERFDREGRAISQLNHPHICTLHDVGHDNGVPYLVLEFLEGETLAARLTRGALPIDQAIAVGIQICDGLDKAHRHGIVHRDLKPGNVMLVGKSATPQVKLLDFGLAKNAGPTLGSGSAAVAVTVSTPVSAPGTILGTLPYMAPEQAEGQDADARSDLFSFGAVMHEMVTGQRAFDGKSAASVIAALLERHPPPLSTLQTLTPPALDHIVARCLAKDPDERWQHAGDVMRELKWVANSPQAATTPQSPRTRERVWMAVAAALALAVATLLLVPASRRATTSPESARTMETSVLPPTRATWSETGAISLSPDGRHVVFVARGANEGHRLWVRSLAESDARPLEGTERGDYPFWSADSRHIGFFVPGQLKRIALDSGPARVVCSVVEGFGGAWNQNDVILFASDEGSIFRVPASGGNPVQVTKAQLPDNFHAWPVFLPDGERFLFVGRKVNAPSDEERSLDLYAATLSAPAGTVVGRVGSNVAYAEPGYLLFLQVGRSLGDNQTLSVQRFDAERMTLTGDPQPLATDVGFTSYASRAVFSASSTGTVVYRTDPPRDHTLVWFDRSGRRLGVVGTPGRYFDPILSPDGNTLAVAAEDPSTRTTDIWFINLARSNSSRFTFGPGLHRMPIWSPDGTRVAFHANRSSGAGVFVKSLTGAEQQLTTREAGFLLPYDWSSDGNLILAERRERTADIVKFAASGRSEVEPVIATSFHEGSPVLSPDGRWLAYQSDQSGRNEVYVRRSDGTGSAEPISGGPGGGFDPQWRRDGKELFYVTTRPDTRLMAVDVQKGETFSMGTPRVLFDVILGRGGDRRFTVTADGQRFLAVTPVVSDPVLPITVVTNWMARLKP